MANRKPNPDSPCAGCGTPLSFLRGEPTRAKGGFYHPNCVPSHSPSMDAEYYAGIRDGWQRYQDKQMFGDEYADAADHAREMRREGYACDMPTPPATVRPKAPKGKVKGEPSYTADYPKIEGYALATDDGCRAAYKAARRYAVKISYSGAAAHPDNAAFDTAVREKMAARGVTEPTPRDWVRFAHAVTWHCGRCGGTGKYIRYVENGVPKGPGGPCYRCGGKGHQNAADAHRNFWHSNFFLARGA